MTMFCVDTILDAVNAAKQLLEDPRQKIENANWYLLTDTEKAARRDYKYEVAANRNVLDSYASDAEAIGVGVLLRRAAAEGAVEKMEVVLRALGVLK